MMEMTVVEYRCCVMSTVGTVCVGGSRPTEVMELAKLMELTVAIVKAETFALPTLSVSAETSTATVDAVCVGGSRPTEVMELAELLEMTVVEVDAAY